MPQLLQRNLEGVERMRSPISHNTSNLTDRGYCATPSLPPIRLIKP
ncbi:hypothetical protein H6F98_01215 [Microcoleus sp. FACHB-SPT15]|nr:hypothetical protein [Microcoleus sp. FACHB-SPT15]MBD1804095.1 hypothetical protein [Microcoleus sp. FACHB-SPT15]